MPEDSMMQIRIGNNLVGIVGLKQIMEEMAGMFSLCPDEEIGAQMIERLSRSNYIPSRVRDLYASALVQEFKKFLGQPIEVPPQKGLRIAVLGPGCSRCSLMETEVREVLAEMNLPAELLHVTDIREISRYGVMGVPALVINDRVVCAGQTPHRNRIREWIKEATSPDRKE
jgi:small redox-active disulfide protein 2